MLNELYTTLARYIRANSHKVAVMISY